MLYNYFPIKNYPLAHLICIHGPKVQNSNRLCLIHEIRIFYSKHLGNITVSCNNTFWIPMSIDCRNRSQGSGIMSSPSKPIHGYISDNCLSDMRLKLLNFLVWNVLTYKLFCHCILYSLICCNETWIDWVVYVCKHSSN